MPTSFCLAKSRYTRQNEPFRHPSAAQYFTCRSDYEQSLIAQTGRARAANHLQRSQLLPCKPKSFLGRFFQQLQRPLAILVTALLHVPIRKTTLQRPRRMLFQHKQPPSDVAIRFQQQTFRSNFNFSTPPKSAFSSGSIGTQSTSSPLMKQE